MNVNFIYTKIKNIETFLGLFIMQFYKRNNKNW